MKAHHLHNLTGEKKGQLLVTCDRYGNPKGVATREECHQGKGKTHLAFMAFVVNEKGNVYLTKRSKTKSLWPNRWDASVVSHVLPGETPEKSAQRRCQEELGVETDFKIVGNFYYFADYGNQSENEYCYILLGKTDRLVDPNPVEINETLEIPWSDVDKFAQENATSITPWFKLAKEKIEKISTYDF